MARKEQPSGRGAGRSTGYKKDEGKKPSDKNTGNRRTPRAQEAPKEIDYTRKRNGEDAKTGSSRYNRPEKPERRLREDQVQEQKSYGSTAPSSRRTTSGRDNSSERKPYATKTGAGSGDRRSRSNNDDTNSGFGAGERKSYSRNSKQEETPRQAYTRSGNPREASGKKPYQGKISDDSEKRYKPTTSRSADVDKKFSTSKREGSAAGRGSYSRNEATEPRERRTTGERPYKTLSGKAGGKAPYREKKGRPEYSQADADGSMRLNKYISNTGICSRREADELIKVGAVTVNGVIVTELGTKIMPTDIVHYGGDLLRRERPVYVLLNKPKDFITTTEDPNNRRTVMALIKDACKERVYPVGRLDRATTGLLLFTNDGDLTKRLTHPSHGVKKIYHVELDKNLKLTDFDKIQEGLELEDGRIEVDSISYVGDKKNEAGVELHSGKNRIVRRIFESLGYEVVKLDRVYFAGLTKRDLPRGRWRHLDPEEVNMLKLQVGGPKKKRISAS